MSTEKPKKKLESIRSIDFNKWFVTFWLVKRKMIQKDAKYFVLRVNINAKLERRFRGYLKNQLQNKEFHVAAYEFNNADGDDTLFAIEAGATNFVKIEAEIDKSFDNPYAKYYKELLNSWAYVVLFEKDDKQLYAWRQINADTQPKKVESKDAIFFHNHKLVDLDEKEIFMIYPRYDFFVYEGTIFIANKRHFESSMNFREGMKANAAEVLDDFDKLNIFNDVTIIQEFVGTNLHHLRKLSSIRKSGYYKQPDYMKELTRINAEESWGLKVVDGKIVVEKETVELLLKLLNNDRLQSRINNEWFDSGVKSPVARPGTG